MQFDKNQTNKTKSEIQSNLINSKSFGRFIAMISFLVARR